MMAPLSLRPRSARRAAVVSRTNSVGPSSSLGEESDGDDGFDAAVECTEKKLRFVWTSEMHQRFEAAVHELGESNAKPQAIRQLMGCEGEESAPTRQNIKSHLQKYRLLLHKQAGSTYQHGANGSSAGFESSCGNSFCGSFRATMPAQGSGPLGGYTSTGRMVAALALKAVAATAFEASAA